ncbi:MAG: hypothetical protein V4622_00790 [Bacteroidota bacterium]
MEKIKTFFKKPLIWIAFASLIFSYLIHFKTDVNFQNMVFSDGSGYYAYLPAFFLQKDASYEKTMKMQESYGEGKQNFSYAIKSKEGKIINKYFPGLAIMQLPAFASASLILYCFDKPLTGYSTTYLLFFYLSSLCYVIIGIYFFLKSLNLYKERNGIEKKKVTWISFICIFFGTNLFFSTLAYPSFSHIYSFFLFSLLIYNFQKYLCEERSRRLLFLGFILGFIFLVRPTNILFVFFLPYFFSSFSELKKFVLKFFSFKKTSFLFILVPFLCIASTILFLNKWQTNEYFYWSYQGEGFNFLNPKFFETLFSYRIGIFVHNPILIICLIGLIFIYKENKYKFFAWLFYFLFITYFISTWWCWDYESSFGHRGFSEHFLIFCFPMMYLFKILGRNKLLIILISSAILYIMMRFYQRIEGIFPRQKFTQETFWKSFFDFDTKIQGKYLNSSHCVPFGKIVKITNIIPKQRAFNFNQAQEFAFDAHFDFPQDRLNNRFFLEVTFKKKIAKNNDWTDILVVSDSYSTKDSSRYYFPLSIYNYYKEGDGEWIETICQDEIPVCFAQKDFCSIYMWNKNRKKFQVKDFEIKMYEYATK